MSKKTNNHHASSNAFTLIEMLIVLIIMGILLMICIGMSGSQIHKIQNKTVKESILSEWQSRYSRNLGSSSFAGEHYNTMSVMIESGSNQIKFSYSGDNSEGIENIFTDKFVIQSIYGDMESVTLKYKPYQFSCSWWNEEDNHKQQKLQFQARVNDNQNYCFEIDSKNCRLREVKCKELGVVYFNKYDQSGRDILRSH